MNRIFNFVVTVIISIVLFPLGLAAQISAPGSVGSTPTSYPVFNGTDSIFIFCADDQMQEIAALQMNSVFEGSKTFVWEKYDENSGTFQPYLSETTDGATSQITGLANGGYRVTVTQGANERVQRAWVFNNWTSVEASIPDSLSNCESFKMIGDFETAQLTYYDLANNSAVDVFKDMKVQWRGGQEIIASVLNPQIFSPPTKNTDYTFAVYDRFGCETEITVSYNSIVTKAGFTADPSTGEAPLDVTFTNTSENGDPGQYEWFFFRSLDDIKEESDNSAAPIDSIESIFFNDNLAFTYEYSGSYMVKLVSKKQSELQTCIDTAYLTDYITVDTSFVAVPNVFTPNGDGTNDEFVVKFWSMKSIEIQIFNRWGKRIHIWESGDVRGFEGTWTESVWDGRLMGGRFASPGVYYYNVVGEGRDGERRRAHGFFHLFRGKD